jgi:uncharacterized membrane protein (DUF485 family)
LKEKSPEERARRARVVRTAILLGIAALTVYVVFIILAAERGAGVIR